MIIAAAADVVTRAMVRAVLAASGVSTAGGRWSSYLQLAPSALSGSGSGSAAGTVPGSDPGGEVNGKVMVQ
jgi:hypothetical protein